MVEYGVDVLIIESADMTRLIAETQRTEHGF